MHNDRLKFMLEQTAERLLDLANRLSDHGKPLTQREKQLARASMLPVVQDMADALVMDYIQGVETDFGKMVEEIRSLQVF